MSILNLDKYDTLFFDFDDTLYVEDIWEHYDKYNSSEITLRSDENMKLLNKIGEYKNCVITSINCYENIEKRLRFLGENNNFRLFCDGGLTEYDLRDGVITRRNIDYSLILDDRLKRILDKNSKDSCVRNISKHEYIGHKNSTKQTYLSYISIFFDSGENMIHGGLDIPPLLYNIRTSLRHKSVLITHKELDKSKIFEYEEFDKERSLFIGKYANHNTHNKEIALACKDYIGVDDVIDTNHWLHVILSDLAQIKTYWGLK